jgi:hypothetical protein
MVTLMKRPITFSTASEANSYIAENGLAGERKPQRVGSRWYLVANPKGTISRALFTHLVAVELRRAGEIRHPRQIARLAAQLWTETISQNRSI